MKVLDEINKMVCVEHAYREENVVANLLTIQASHEEWDWNELVEPYK